VFVSGACKSRGMLAGVPVGWCKGNVCAQGPNLVAAVAVSPMYVTNFEMRVSRELTGGTGCVARVTNF
jgi:hypothetical protein